MTDTGEQIDLATDPRAARLRDEINDLKAAMLELLESPDLDPLETKMADRVRSTPQSPGDIEACNRSRREFVERKRKLIQSIATDGFKTSWQPITVVIVAGGQVWPTDGMHRTASLLALGMPVPAVIQQHCEDGR